MKKSKNDNCRYVAMCKHDSAAPPSKVFVGTYEEVLAKAGKFWESYDGLFDITKSPKEMFSVEPDTIDEDIEVCVEKGEVTYFSHANGEGPCIEIVKETL